ncbi:restriction endonuclease subunit S [Streptomyces sp. NPDC004538]|uniref:restriction endonuclease subunit S n=1 Tax=Streptomyces sp. NPDC004538 TaxID=3154279 RepID=UPI0033B30A07
MVEWPVRELGDLCTRITVGHVGSMASRYVPRGIPFLRSQNVKPGRINLSSLKFIDKEFHDKLTKSQLNAGDLVIVRTGEPGVAAVIPHGMGSMNCSDLVIARPAADVDVRFLCYAINETATGFVRAHVVGAVQQHFNVSSAKRLTIRLPPIDEQQRIVGVLGALDDKIALNNRIAVTAEELCRNVFSEKSWEARTSVESIAILRKEQVSPAVLSEQTVAHYSLPAFDSEKLPEITDPCAIKSSKFVVPESAVLFSKLNPDIPRVWNVAPELNIPALASTEFLVLEARSGVTTAELWAVLCQPGLLSSLASKVTGTSKSHQRVRPAEVMASAVVDPRELGDCRGQVQSLAERIARARNESRTLATLRDTLLPQLMSGKLRVREAEKIVEDAV